MKKIISLLCAVLVLTSPARAIDVNGQLKRAQLERLSSDPTGTEARVYWNTADQRAKVYNGTDWTTLGSGGTGSGGKNYIENPSGETNTTGWTCVGDLDITRTTTAADLPRENTTATGLKITADANTQSVADYCYYDFTLDDVDLSKKLGLTWAQKTTGSYNASDLAVIVTTQADRTTALHTPTTTNIPDADLVFPTDFDTSTTTTLSLVIRATTDMTTDAGIVISDVIVSPDKVAVPGVAAQYLGGIGTWTFSPTGAKDFVITDKCWRLMNRLQCNIKLDGDTDASGTTGNNITLTLPSGYTIDSSIDTSYAGRWTSLGVEALSAWSDQKTLSTTGTTGFVFRRGDTASGATTSALRDTELNTAQNMDIYVWIDVPIAEWAGSGTVNAVNNDCQYAYNSNTTTTAGNSDTTSFAYGPGGTAIVAIDSTTDDSQTNKRVRFLRSVQETDVVSLQVKQSGFTGWQSVASTNYVWGRQSNRRYGMKLIGVSGSSTDFDVSWGNAGVQSGGTYATSGTAWSTQTSSLWRVELCSGGSTRGFSRASQNSLGLVKAGQVPGTNTNDDAEDGNVGEYEFDSGTGVNIPTATNTEVAGSIVLTSGDWIVSGALMLTPAATTTVSSILYAISDDATGLPGATARAKPNACEYENAWYYGGATTSGNLIGFAIPSYRCSVASGSTKTLYLVARATIGTSTMTADGSLWARRIR